MIKLGSKNQFNQKAKQTYILFYLNRQVHCPYKSSLLFRPTKSCLLLEKSPKKLMENFVINYDL